MDYAWGGCDVKALYSYKNQQKKMKDRWRPPSSLVNRQGTRPYHPHTYNERGEWNWEVGVDGGEGPSRGAIKRVRGIKQPGTSAPKKKIGPPPEGTGEFVAGMGRFLRGSGKELYPNPLISLGRCGAGWRQVPRGSARHKVVETDHRLTGRCIRHHCLSSSTA